MANKQRRTTIQGEAWKKLEALLGKSMKVIEKELEEGQTVILMDGAGGPLLDEKGFPKTMRVGGNPKVAMWMIDKLTGNTGGLLIKEIGVEIKTMDGVIEAAQKTVELVLAREMALDDAVKLIDLLMRYAAIRAFDGIEELRKMMLDLNGKTITGTVGAPTEMRPSWGKLQHMTAINEGRPAE